jgi:hypothetical protein
MQEQEIIHYLKLLGEELKELQLQHPIRVLMIGGAYMITQFGSRVFTEDIDVLVRLDKQSGEYRKFKNAIRFIASDVRESQKWLTDNIGDFMEEVGKIPEGRLWLKHGMLEVYVPEPQYILALNKSLLNSLVRGGLIHSIFLSFHFLIMKRKGRCLWAFILFKP